MGHANLQRLQQMLRDGELKALPPDIASELKSASDIYCESCAHGKLTRRKHRSSGHRSDERRFHSDTYGPCPISYADKLRYAVIFVHQPTALWFLSGLHTRSRDETLAAFKFAISVAAKNGHTIAAFMSDNGREFLGGPFDEYLTERGILRQLSAPGRQDSNGRAERVWSGSANIVGINARPPVLRPQRGPVPNLSLTFTPVVRVYQEDELIGFRATRYDNCWVTQDNPIRVVAVDSERYGSRARRCCVDAPR